MSAIVLRPAALTDIDAITAIYRDAVLHGTATYELTPPDAREMQARFQAITNQRYPYIVAEDAGGTVLGYAYASAFRTRPAYRWFCEDSIYLSPEAKGKRVGTQLLQRLVELTTELGFRQMVAVIGGADHAPSIKLHERAGFRHIGVLEGSGFKFGRWIDTVLMQLPLGEGKDTLPDEAAYPGTLYGG
ncbi:GNAT family N-acetyltransferase [Mangrovibrevibacter kandeliae]|uniref:GNAT family N-acetyltransferase n=1 Tax=Mangrovibrevibacter kandeliae TaxID=2968473 RepID=UPI002117FDB5|nr:GNAT family N-acetyltransferase [Aurantimonas sp. CSK15Z-1]MCQ8781926.1 GNAT family N-acetyltransferase [Aurantimonas sp. CSK15Z-1]